MCIRDRYYTDTWNLKAHTVNIALHHKPRATFTWYPFVRLYQQNGIAWFKPYGEHNSAEKFYSSDYDLSSFNAVNMGLGFHYQPLNGLTRFKLPFLEAGKIKGLKLQAGRYLRSDGLSAWYATMAFSFDPLYVGK